MWWESIVGGITGIVEAGVTKVGDYFIEGQRQAAEKQRRADEYAEAVHQRKVELIKQGLAADANWEQAFAEQAASSWKDEYTLIVFTIPYIMCFIPGLSPYVDMGFEAIARTPMWYQGIVGSLVLATVGIRMWRRQQSDT